MQRNTKPYPTAHARDIWDAPQTAFMHGISMTVQPACDYLGLPRDTLIRYVDDLGLTVLRRPPGNWRYFLVSELRELKEKLDNYGIIDLAELGRFGNEIPLLDHRKKKKKRKWRKGKGY